jgi:nucleoside-diphosphate-sugar epimerase
MTSQADRTPTHRSGPKRILITGASGCVGQYLVEELLAQTQHRLVLVVRNPGKLPAAVAGSAQVEIIEADVTDVDGYRDRLGHIDVAMLVAACWGGPDAFRVNVEANLALATYLADNGGDRVLYFATGSVIDADGRMLPAARELGSEYIRSKYQLVEEIEKLGDRIDIVGLYPTLILGGGDGKPMSHFGNLLREARPWAWLARFLRADGKFHFVHARDIARVARHLADAPLDGLASPRRLVLGNPATTVNDFIVQFVAYLGLRTPFTVTLKDWLAEGFIKIFRIELSPWDRYCMQHRDLSYKKVYSPADFGLPVACPDLATGLGGIGIPRRA